MALGGGTNAVIHLLALAGRLGVPLTLDRFDELSRRTPVIGNLRPSGEHLFEHLHRAGGVQAVLKQLAPAAARWRGDRHRRDAGAGLRERGDARSRRDRDARRAARRARRAGHPARQPRAERRGHQAERGVGRAVAPSRSGARVRGRLRRAGAHRRSRARGLADTVLVLRNSGPRGGPGMPEWGQVPIPKKLLAQGVTDMVRVSDARMSGTAFGTVVLHVAPESAAGGPLAAVRDGDPDRARRGGAAHRPGHPGRRDRAPPRARRRRARPRTSAATARSTSSTCCRPTRAATSTSCAPFRASRPRASRSACSAAGWAAGDLEHHLAARRRPPEPARRTPRRSRRARSGGVTICPGWMRPGVEQLDDPAPGRRRVAEARREREVVVDEQVGRQLERLPGRRQAEQQHAAASARGAGARALMASGAPAASITRSKPSATPSSVVKLVAPTAAASAACSGRRPSMTISAGDQSAGEVRREQSDRAVADHEHALARLGRGLLEPAHDDGRRLDERGIEQRDGRREHVHEPARARRPGRSRRLRG